MRFVFPFPSDETCDTPLETLGAKGAGLLEMSRIGIPVPPGFTISTQAGSHLLKQGHWPQGLESELASELRSLRTQHAHRHGTNCPMLVSVRSGAAASMPGMMDTILNVGLTESTIDALSDHFSDRRFALDAYRRLLQMYGALVLGVDASSFERALGNLKAAVGHSSMKDAELDAEALRRLADTYLEIIEREGRGTFPQDPEEQIRAAIVAVMQSWKNVRAARYRKMQHIDDGLGTACTVQTMVFGNRGARSGSGVAFTRNPSNGQPVLYGEYLAQAQGEDVVSGTRTPSALTVAASMPGREDHSLERALPDAFATLKTLCRRLEEHFEDAQDIEFTVQDEEVFVLQTRPAKRTPQAAVRIAVDLVREGTLDEAKALMRIEPKGLRRLLHATVPTEEQLADLGIKPLAAGLPASPGAATGRIVFDAGDAEKWSAEGQDVILVRRETSPEDVHGIKVAKGVVTAAGGMTSHAAVVTRGLATACIAGCGTLRIDEQNGTISIGERGHTTVLRQGDVITLDGSRGRLYAGELELSAAPTLPEFGKLMQWADDARALHIRANADTPSAARSALSYGAEGIGLCRTEHMFFADDRLFAIRCALLSDTVEARAPWLRQLEEAQQRDFVEIFESMGGRPVTLRLLDWLLHDLLPEREEDIEAIAEALNRPLRLVERAVQAQREVNPMLGRRGVRLGVVTPELYEMQIRAILVAATHTVAAGGVALPEILIPFVTAPEETARFSETIATISHQVSERHGVQVAYRVGAMIEVPRACLLADRIAPHVDFFSFGTNDLTQTCLGLSRDDAPAILPKYTSELGMPNPDPFRFLDVEGVGALMRIAIDKGRQTNPSLEIGVCGSHSSQPHAIRFFERLGAAYLSCTPQDLPTVRLAAAQSHIRATSKTA